MTDRRVVHVIDDEIAVQRSIAFMLRTSGFAAETWSSGSAFLRAVRTAPRGCVLLDVRMPEIDGLEVQRRLTDTGVTMPVIVLTGHGDVLTAVTAMRQGAVDFLEKPFEKTALISALDLGFDQLEQRSGTVLTRRDAALRIAILTPREREVLDGLARGHPNKTIAFDLGISPRTVEVHRANIMDKLGVHSFSDALRIAFAAGYGMDEDKYVENDAEGEASAEMPSPE